MGSSLSRQDEHDDRRTSTTTKRLSGSAAKAGVSGQAAGGVMDGGTFGLGSRRQARAWGVGVLH